MTHSDRLIYAAGKCRGIAIAYLARARGAHGEAKRTLVRLALNESKEAVRYMLAAKGEI